MDFMWVFFNIVERVENKGERNISEGFLLDFFFKFE